MSILNNTLKSLDDRNQESDFGLPPTVQLRKSFSIRKVFALIAVLVLVVWSALYFIGDKPESSQNSTISKEPSANASETPSKIASEALPQTAYDTSDSSPSEGMQSVPLSDKDRALLAQSTPVVEQVFEQESEQVFEQVPDQLEQDALEESQAEQSAFDDEAEYRKAREAAIQEERLKEAATQATASVTGIKTATADNNADDRDAVENIIADRKRTTTNSTVVNSTPAITPKTQKQQSAVHLDAGLNAYQFGMFEDAEQNFLLALQVEPKNHEARKQLAALYFGQNNIPMALSVLSKGVSIEPQNLMWRELMGKILIAKSRFEEALSVMPEAFNQQAVKEQRSDYLIIMGTAAQAINKPEVAISAFSAMTVLQPQNGKWWLALGVNYDQLGQDDEAIKAFEAALAQGGVSPASKQYVIERLNALKEVR
ncbi:MULTISPECIES: tetratricopeptide repeat protein [unclassified Alteromonas]|uniref:tetratricopeptide repeat protein n=1 Tax=unclassified Alteromonas TaxID=2614992 RepID=UPI000509E8DB|nr:MULTISPECIES: tetratricopeptide repeat protein [unclassified Alteromonas]